MEIRKVKQLFYKTRFISCIYHFIKFSYKFHLIYEHTGQLITKSETDFRNNSDI